MEKKGIIYTKASSVKFKTDAEIVREMIEGLERRLKRVEEAVHGLKCLKKEG